MKTLELYKFGIDYYVIRPSTIILMNRSSRLDGINIDDKLHIISEDLLINWIGTVKETGPNSVTLKVHTE